MLLKGSENFMLKHGILGLLNYGSMTGYDIMLTFRNSLNYLRNPLMMKIFFRGELGIEENIEYFKKLLNQCDDFMKLIEKSPFDVDMYEGMIENPEKALYWKMTVEFGFMYSQIYREWLEKCIKEMEELINENTAD